MRAKTFLIGALVIAVAGCTGEAPIRKTNCWASMALLHPIPGNCVFHDVDAG